MHSGTYYRERQESACIIDHEGVTIRAGMTCRFTTRFHPCREGLVLDVSPDAEFPVRIEFEMQNGGKTIQSFGVGEFFLFEEVLSGSNQ